MKLLPRVVRRSMFTLLHKTVNLFVIFAFMLQPFGATGFNVRVLASEGDATVVDPAVVASVETSAPKEETVTPVEEKVVTPPKEVVVPAEITPVVVAPTTETVAPIETPVVAPATEEVTTATETTPTETAVTSPETPADTAIVETPASTETPVTTETTPTTETIVPTPVEVPAEVAPEVLAPVVETWSATVGNKATTNNPVELGKVYVAPQNDQVTVTFTKLPEKVGTLSIEEITLTPEQVKTLGALSDKAYDITSDMVDGTFAYDLTLPKSTDQKDVQIKFAETVAGLKNADTVATGDVKTETDSVSASLDHFTIFVVTSPVQSGLLKGCTVGVTGATVSDRCFNTIQAAIDAVTTPGETIIIAAGTYAENITINGKTNLTITGAGVGTIIEPVNAANSIGIIVSNSNGLKIQDLKIHTRGSESQGIRVLGFANTHVTGLTIQHLTIEVSGAATGIIGDPSTDAAHSGWLIHGNTITAGSGGIGLQDVTNSTISDNNITISDGTNVYWTSEKFNLNNLVFSGNTVSGSGGSQVSFLTDWNETGTKNPVESPITPTTITGITISGNTFSNWGADTNNGRALRIDRATGTGEMTGIAITSNTFQMTADRPEVIGGAFASTATGSANIFNVSGGAKIQKAVNSALGNVTTGDVINVAAGTYAENVTISGKTKLTLQGVGPTSILAPATADNSIGITIANSNGLTIQHLKIQTYGAESQGIKVLGFTNNGVTGLTIHGTTIVADAATGIIADPSYVSVHSGWLIDGNTITAGSGGIGIQDVTNSTISNNNITISDGTNVLWTSEGFDLNALVLSGNTVNGSGGSQVSFLTDYNHSFPDPSKTPPESPLFVSHITTVTVSGNTFDTWGSRGLRIGTGVSGVAVSQNKFMKAGEALKNEDASSVNAECNWWNTTDYNTILPKVIGTVDFVSYLATSNIDTPVCTGGVWPVHNVTQNLYYQTIQLAIDAAVTSDVIEVAAGTYAENITINGKTNLTLQGVGQSTETGTVIEPADAANSIGITVSNSNGLKIQNLRIHTRGAESQGIKVLGLGTYNGVTGLTIQDTTIAAGAATGIYADPSYSSVHSGWLIDGNTITAGSGGIGIQDVTASTISDNKITITDGTNILWTSEKFDLSALVLSGNTVNGSGGSQVTFLTDYNHTYPDPSKTPPESPLFVSHITTVTVSGNTFENWGSRGLRIGSGVSDVAVSQNKFMKAGEALNNESSSDINAESNYWGEAMPTFSTKIVTTGGAVDHDPWFIDAGMGTLATAVTFDANGSTGGTVPADQAKIYYVTLTLATNSGTLVKTGYTFVGWNTLANGLGDNYATGANYTANVGVTLYAKWTINTYTVTFDNNTGSGSMSNETADYNVATALTANTFTKTGYTFAGWATSADGAVVYADGASYPFTASATLYAKWTAVSQTLTFESNGGDAVTAITQDFATSVSAPTPPTKTGYTFAGWYNEVGLSTVHTFNTMGLTTTIYAQWTAVSQTLTFESNGGDAVTAITQDFATSVSAPTPPTKTGYTFAGWYNEVGLTTTYTFPHSMGLTTTIYAQWTAVSQTLAFNSNGGSAVASKVQAYDSAVTTPADPTKTGYTFAGWYNEVGLSTVHTFNTMGLSTTLYAKWTDSTSPTTPTATPIAGDYDSNQSVTLASSDAGSGLAGIYYTVDGTTPDNSKTLYAGVITVDHDMTIKAIAYDSVGNTSSVLSATYGIAPVISGETSSSVSGTSVTITWTTDDLSTSRVIYGTASVSDATVATFLDGSNYGYASSTVEDSTEVTSHLVGLTGLLSGTTYYYRTVSHGSPETVSAERTFSTSDITDPDNVSNLDATYKQSPDRVQLTWDVNDSDIDMVYIYQGKSKNFSVNTSTRIAKNSRNDTNFSDYNVTPGEKYYYKVVTVDAAGNKSSVKVISITLPTEGTAAVVTNEGTEVLPAGTVLGAETTNPSDTVTTSPDTQTSGKTTTDNSQNNGKVLGADTTNTNGDNGGLAFWQWILIIFIVGGVGYFGTSYFRRNRSSLS